jgi:hypothetical protein
MSAIAPSCVIADTDMSFGPFNNSSGYSTYNIAPLEFPPEFFIRVRMQPPQRTPSLSFDLQIARSQSPRRPYLQRHGWSLLSEASLQRIWDNEADAIYDNWRELYDVPAR